MIRIAWTVSGLVSLGLGIIGAALPLLPTVPFLLLAAFCFAKSSPLLHSWLLEHKFFGPPIRDWQRSGAIGRHSKLAATVSIAVVFGASLALDVKTSVLIIKAVVLTTVLVFIWSRPEA